MEKAKLLHGAQIVFLLGITAVILFAVTRVRPGYLLELRYQETSGTIPTAASAQLQTDDISDAVQVQPETEWIPPIEYDAYTPSEIDQTAFRETVVLGNSQAQALSNFGLMKNADFVTRVGLAIHQVLTSKTGAPPIASLYGKQYRKAVFIFGENELGWPYPENFVTHYKKVIAKVRELNPGIEIYCQAIFPVSADYSKTSTNGITNEHVRQFNAMLEKMCKEIDAHFMPFSSAFEDSTGALPEGAATDGVHFGYDYCKIWAGDLSAYLQDQNVLEWSTEQGLREEGVTEE